MFKCELPKPHENKLTALLANENLPEDDRPRVQEAIERYQAWVQAMDTLDLEGEALLTELVRLLNAYKRTVEVDLIFDSPANFLYRQKGQHKVDNSVLEEFLPRLADTRLVPGLKLLKHCAVGPQSAFAAFIFAGSAHTPLNDGGIFIKKKDQDYALSKKVYVKASGNPTFTDTDTLDTVLDVAYLAAECKTNLDKTMFNEGMETARALKQAVSGSRYLLICEWLDMLPIDTASTDIEEVIILRKSSRLGSQIRKRYNTVASRAAAREQFVTFYDAHPLRAECFARLVQHMNKVYPESIILDETTVLERGYF
jgi:Bpu10I restriction endonuclease